MHELAAKILAKPDQTFARLRVPEWDVVVRIRTWDAATRADFDAESEFLAEHLPDGERRRLAMARAAAWSIVDDDAKLVFAVPSLAELQSAQQAGKLDDALDVYRRLAEKSGRGLQRVYNAASDLNALTDEEEYEIEGKS